MVARRSSVADCWNSVSDRRFTIEATASLAAEVARGCAATQSNHQSNHQLNHSIEPVGRVMLSQGPIEDRLQIRELIDSYNNAVMRFDGETWASNWAEDGFGICQARVMCPVEMRS